MTSHLLHSLFFAFILFFNSADGRSLQQNNNNEVIDFSRVFPSNNTVAKAKAVSLATDHTYTGKTNYNDVLGLAALCNTYPWLLERNDDPCLPPKWTWIRCNADAKPRIITLDLGSKLLVGLLPDFSYMDALQRIDFSQNSLIGTIPSFLGTFSDLQELNLAYNLFSGLVPDSLACNKNLKLSLDGNTNLYTSNFCSTSKTPPTANRNNDSSSTTTTTSSFQTPAVRSRKKSKLPVIVGSTISIFLVFWIAAGIFAIYRHKAKAAAAVAEATRPGLTNPNANIPTEEKPINAASNNMTSP